MLAPLQIDFYKSSHYKMYHPSTTKLYSNFTPRSAHHFKGSSLYDGKVVNVGLQRFVKDYLIQEWNCDFFERPIEDVSLIYKGFMDATLGKDSVGIEHIEALHKLGYLPLTVKALPEGTRSPIGVPVLTIINTHPDFFWLTNYIESVMSAELWKPMTTATIAYEYRRVFEHYADLTGASKYFIPFQGHDFSFRGMSGRHDAANSGIGHLTSFIGTDTVPAILAASVYYNEDPTKTLIGTSVPATEHSIMTTNIEFIKQQLDSSNKAWQTPSGRILTDKMLQFDTSHTDTQQLAEIAYIWYLITELCPTGIISIVSDSFDFWYMMEYGIKVLKPIIEARDGKVVFRPDSGDPVDVICGFKLPSKIYALQELNTLNILELKKEGYNAIWSDAGGIKHIQYFAFTPSVGHLTIPTKYTTQIEAKGAMECLYDAFGYTTNDKDFKVLNPKVGLIYGDSITIERQEQILSKLSAKGFATDCIVLGIGSYTYQMISRDTLGFAMKATYTEINDKPYDIYKDPKTSDGTKKSAKGLLRVNTDDHNKICLIDQQTIEQESQGLLQPVFTDGKLLKETTLTDIRNLLWL